MTTSEKRMIWTIVAGFGVIVFGLGAAVAKNIGMQEVYMAAGGVAGIVAGVRLFMLPRRRRSRRNEENL